MTFYAKPYEIVQLPIVIDGPGEYLTRGGGHVLIHDIDGRGTFSCRGSFYRMYRGKYRPKDFGLWHHSGRYRPLAEHSRDIIGKAL